MASILLIRHGQAGFGKLNYDQLSKLGWQQAELIGRALHARGFAANYVAHGNMQRHRETLQGAQKHWHNYGVVASHAGLDEFSSDDVIACAFPQFKQKAVLGAWLLTQTDARKAFQQLFVQAVTRWAAGQHDADYLESWAQFQQRVIAALHDTIARSAGKDIALFTSGGPITVIAQHCLGLSNQQAFELNWMLVNGGLSQCLFSKNAVSKVSLASFNEQQFLAQAGSQFLTYR